MGKLRGSYHKHSEVVILRIIKEGESGGDWVSIAEANGVPYKTAHHWLRTGYVQINRRATSNGKKVSDEQVSRILIWLEEDPQMTLQEIRDRVEVEMQVNVTPQTIGRYLDGQMFTTKLVHLLPEGVNNNSNKQLRRDYALAAMEYAADEKVFIFMDESNFNLFCRRSVGRSRRGFRAVVKLPNSKGPNLHLIGGMSSNGDFFLERQRGSFTAVACKDWVCRCISYFLERGNLARNIILVLDNAPAHSSVENALNQYPCVGVKALRLAPYSAMLNPIEHIWSTIKSHVRNYMRQHFASLMAGDPHCVLTKTEFRLRFLEQAADQAVVKITPDMCIRAYQHVQQLFPAALDLQDMQVGV
jgi:transposase